MDSQFEWTAPPGRGATPALMLGGLYRRFGKRLFDLLLAVILLPLVGAVIAVLWCLVRLDGGPGFYAHARVGERGQTFSCWKLRSMVPDAGARLAEHLASNPAAASEWARCHKLSNDPRVTRIGRLLRSTCMDELPQILNVLLGQMSFVGPRPVTAAELEKYGVDVSHYLACKPGITGLWQASGRTDLTYRDRVKLDRDYSLDIRLLRDLSILLRTVPTVVGRALSTLDGVVRH